jgi:hypothetical protein
LTKNCKTCRYNPDNENNMAGGDCANCEGFSEWRELKREDPKKCKTCLYEDNGCHYMCVECQDAKNWTPKESLKEILTNEIEKREKEIEEYKRLLEKLDTIKEEN